MFCSSAISRAEWVGCKLQAGELIKVSTKYRRKQYLGDRRHLGFVENIYYGQVSTFTHTQEYRGNDREISLTPKKLGLISSQTQLLAQLLYSPWTSYKTTMKWGLESQFCTHIHQLPSSPFPCIFIFSVAEKSTPLTSNCQKLNDWQMEGNLGVGGLIHNTVMCTL